MRPVTEEEDRHRERENRYEIGRHRSDAGTDSAHDPVEEDEARDRACEREVQDVQPHSGGPAGDVRIALLKETEDASEHDGQETPSAEIGSRRDRDRRENDRGDDEPHGRDLERRRARDSELTGDPGTAPSKRDAECDKRCEQRAGHRRTIRGTMPPCYESSSPASPDSQVVISPNTSCCAATRFTAALTSVRPSETWPRSRIASVSMKVTSRASRTSRARSPDRGPTRSYTSRA